MAIPEGARSVNYGIRANGHDHEGEMTHVEVSVSAGLDWSPRRQDTDRAAQAIAGAAAAVMADMFPDHTVAASRWYDCTVPGDPWPAPPGEEPPVEEPRGDGECPATAAAATRG